jgi:hypothetical protein
LSWDIIQHHTSGADVQNLRALEGRVWSCSNITRPFVAIKLAIDSSALCNQAPNTKTLETIINAIIASWPLKFLIDRAAVISFEQAIKTRSSGNLYLSYASLSPCLPNPHNHPPPIVSISRRQLKLFQDFLHSHLDGPECFHNIPNLPPFASHFKVSITFTNDMDESLHFFIEGVSVTLLLGDRQVKTILSLHHLRYLIFNEVKSLYSTFPPHNPFPPNLNKFRTRFAIGSLIPAKKRFGFPPNNSRHNINVTHPPSIHKTARPTPFLVLSSQRHHPTLTSYTTPSNLSVSGTTPASTYLVL